MKKLTKNNLLKNDSTLCVRVSDFERLLKAVRAQVRKVGLKKKEVREMIAEVRQKKSMLIRVVCLVKSLAKIDQ